MPRPARRGPAPATHMPSRGKDAGSAADQSALHAGKRPRNVVQNGLDPLVARHVEAVCRACRIIESAETEPSLAMLARDAGLSPGHFQRVFKSVTGVSPKAYAAARRAEALRTALRNERTVTDAGVTAGYGSSSRLHAAAQRSLGMPPRAYRSRGARQTIRFAVGQSSLGAILVARSERGICAISLGDDPDALLSDLQERFANAELLGGDRDFERLVATVVGLVEDPRRGCDLPLDIRGTAFQERVWRALQRIPPGSTLSYAEVAARIGEPHAVRAVANACANNKLAVAIPCHRVVRSDGRLAGYRWGIDRKRELLRRESAGPAA